MKDDQVDKSGQSQEAYRGCIQAYHTAYGGVLSGNTYACNGESPPGEAQGTPTERSPVESPAYYYYYTMVIVVVIITLVPSVVYH